MFISASYAFCFSGIETKKGDQVYQLLVSNNLLEDYIIKMVDDVSSYLIEAAEIWNGYQINGPYKSDLINIYLINSAYFPTTNLVPDYDIVLDKDNIKKNLLVDEENQIIFVDTQLLKELLTCIFIYVSDDRAKLSHTVANVRIKVLDAYSKLWDPNQNNALKSGVFSQMWVKLFQGTFAFMLGHEMGHINLGKQTNVYSKYPIRYDRRYRDLHWACPELVASKYQQMQKIERAADNFCIDLLTKIKYHKNRTFIRYELGAHWFLLYQLESELIKALHVSGDQFVHNLLQMRFGENTYKALLETESTATQGLVSVFFHKTHPAAVSRMFDALTKLSYSKYSVYYGESPDADVRILKMLVERVCNEVKQKYNQD